MGGLSIWHWLVVGIVVMLLFGKGRFSDMMGDVAKGIKSFKHGMRDEDEANRTPPRDRLEGPRPADLSAPPAADTAPVAPVPPATGDAARDGERG